MQVHRNLEIKRTGFPDSGSYGSKAPLGRPNKIADGSSENPKSLKHEIDKSVNPVLPQSRFYWLRTRGIRQIPETPQSGKRELGISSNSPPSLRRSERENRAYKIRALRNHQNPKPLNRDLPQSRFTEIPTGGRSQPRPKPISRNPAIRKSRTRELRISLKSRRDLSRHTKPAYQLRTSKSLKPEIGESGFPAIPIYRNCPEPNKPRNPAIEKA